MLRFIVIFMVTLVVLFTLELVGPVERHVIMPITSAIATVSTWLISLFDADAIATGNVIRSTTTGFAISIERGCNGIEAVIILISAMFAFPSPWRHKLVGILIGTVAIQLLNLVRIISLFYLGQWDMRWFEWFHLYLWQALIVLDALIVFLFWLRWLPQVEDPVRDVTEPTHTPA